MSFLGFFLMSIVQATVLVFQKLNIGHIDYTMVSFDQLVSAEKRVIIRKFFVTIADYQSTLESQTFKEYSEKISSKLEVLVGGLEQKISDEHK